MELGPSIKPGDKVLRWESVKYDILVPATVLAVLETGSLRMAFFYLPAWTEAGRDQSPDAAYGVPALGRGWWFSSRGVSAWSVAHYQPWEGPKTLEDTLAALARIHGETTVAKATDIDVIVAGEETRPEVIIRRK